MIACRRRAYHLEGAKCIHKIHLLDQVGFLKPGYYLFYVWFEVGDYLERSGRVTATGTLDSGWFTILPSPRDRPPSPTPTRHLTTEDFQSLNEDKQWAYHKPNSTRYFRRPRLF